MPIVVGIVLALTILLVLGVIGAALVGEAYYRSRQRYVDLKVGPTPLDVDDGNAPAEDPDELEDWLASGWHSMPADEKAWWWSGDVFAPETVVIEGSRGSSATAVAEGGTPEHTAAKSQVWTIHPDHTAHWEDEAGDCPWCRNEPV
jgi:hypothetical protein